MYVCVYWRKGSCARSSMGGGVGETGKVPPWTLKGQFKRLHLHNNDEASDDNKNKEILITPDKLVDCAIGGC